MERSRDENERPRHRIALHRADGGIDAGRAFATGLVQHARSRLRNTFPNSCKARGRWLHRLWARWDFIGGSNTVSNMLFGNIQYLVADRLGISHIIILSEQTVGGAFGVLISLSKSLRQAQRWV